MYVSYFSSQKSHDVLQKETYSYWTSLMLLKNSFYGSRNLSTFEVKVIIIFFSSHKNILRFCSQSLPSSLNLSFRFVSHIKSAGVVLKIAPRWQHSIYWFKHFCSADIMLSFLSFIWHASWKRVCFCIQINFRKLLFSFILQRNGNVNNFHD